MSTVERPLRILTVCSHNRTRSVMSAALLRAMLTDRLGPDVVDVRSTGFGPIDLPPIIDAVDAMRRRGLDVSAHRSQVTTLSHVDGADVILTAERDHVVKIAALSPLAFRRALTLPEFLALAADAPDDLLANLAGDVAGDVAGDAGRTGSERVAAWVERLTEDRRAGAYLREPVPEVADPTGSAPRAFEAAVVTIEQQCREVAAHLVRVFDAS